MLNSFYRSSFQVPIFADSTPLILQPTYYLILKSSVIPTEKEINSKINQPLFCSTLSLIQFSASTIEMSLQVALFLWHSTVSEIKHTSQMIAFLLKALLLFFICPRFRDSDFRSFPQLLYATPSILQLIQINSSIFN